MSVSEAIFDVFVLYGILNVAAHCGHGNSNNNKPTISKQHGVVVVIIIEIVHEVHS